MSDRNICSYVWSMTNVIQKSSGHCAWSLQHSYRSRASCSLSSRNNPYFSYDNPRPCMRHSGVYESIRKCFRCCTRPKDRSYRFLILFPYALCVRVSDQCHTELPGTRQQVPYAYASLVFASIVLRSFVCLSLVFKSLFNCFAIVRQWYI